MSQKIKKIIKLYINISTYICKWEQNFIDGFVFFSNICSTSGLSVWYPILAHSFKLSKQWLNVSEAMKKKQPALSRLGLRICRMSLCCSMGQTSKDQSGLQKGDCTYVQGGKDLIDGPGFLVRVPGHFLKGLLL